MIPPILRQASRGDSRDAVAVSRKITSRDTVHGRSLREVRERTPVTRRNSRAFVSVASVRMSRHVFIRKML